MWAICTCIAICCVLQVAAILASYCHSAPTPRGEAHLKAHIQKENPVLEKAKWDMGGKLRAKRVGLSQDLTKAGDHRNAHGRGGGGGYKIRPLKERLEGLGNKIGGA